MKIRSNPEGQTKSKTFTANMLEIITVMNESKYKAIILYLVPDDGQIKPELGGLMGEMAARGYLCFICPLTEESSTQKDTLQPDPEDKSSAGVQVLQPDLYVVSQGLSLIPILRNLSAIVLTTQNIHPDWAELLDHKLLWLHAGEGFSETAEDNYEDLYKEADLISYFPEGSLKMEEHLADDRCIALDPGLDHKINADLLEERIKSLPFGWQVYANLELKGKVAVMAETFLDFEGSFFYSGGAERYLLDLAEICRELDREMVIFQYGNYPWIRRLKNIDIVSLSRRGTRAQGWILKCARDFNRIFYELVEGRSALNIYSAFYEAWPLAASPSIGISHGVSWDHPYCEFENAMEFWIMNQRYIEGAQACEELVSVDTNTANWFQTVDFSLGQRIRLIPNYADLSMFKPARDHLKKKEKTVILYPRQLYSARGLYLVLEIMEDVLEKYPKTEFHFVGRGGEQDIARVLEKQAKWGERVKYYPLSLEEMPRAYQAADISLIPTVHSEGTSLSCLEAMASGNAVVATRVGGLSDLIINNYNGFLIDPRPEELKEAIINLLENHERLILFKKRNPEVAKAFSKTLWKDRWKELLKNKINKRGAGFRKKSRAVQVILADEEVDYGKLGIFITKLLGRGDLVYIRAASVPDPDLSFGRIQWLAPDAPLFSICDETIEYGRRG